MIQKFLATAAIIMACPFAAIAYIMPTRTILQKTSENAGASNYVIEQEVQFSNGDDTIQLKEVWLVGNDHTMRLTVTGSKELQNTFKMQFVYNGGLRWRLIGDTTKNEKVSEDFLEKYFNFRNPEGLVDALTHHQILPPGAYNKKPAAKTSKDIIYEPESWVRLSRSGGVPNYALGTATPEDQAEGNPGIWIEQDQFFIRKLRLKSHAEMTADNYKQFSKGLNYPRNQTVRWGNNTVNILLTSLSSRPKMAANLFQPNSLDTALKVEGLDHIPAKEAILEFYSRFR
jgi:hypothetical protein